MGIVQAGSGAANARSPIGTGPTAWWSSCRTIAWCSTPFDSYYGGRPTNAGLVLKVVPDDTMRGLELRKGTVDIVVNDLSPDIVWQLRAEGRLQVATAPGTDYAYIGLNLRDPDPAATCEVRQAIGYAIDREAIVELPAPRLRPRRPSASCRRCRGRSSRSVFDFTHDPATRAAAARRGRLSRSRRRRAAAAVPAVAEDLDVGGLPPAGGGDPAGPRARRHRGRRAVERAADAVRRRASAATSSCTRCSGSASPIPTCCAASITRSRRRRPASIACLYSNPDVDRLIDERPPRPTTASGGALYTRAQRLDRQGRAVHQPLVQDERRGVPAGPPRRRALADRRLHVPEGRVSRGSRPAEPSALGDARALVLIVGVRG